MQDDILSQVPIRHDQVSIAEENDVYSIHDQQEGKIFLTNEMGAKVWDLCDGTNTVNDIIKIVDSQYEEMTRDKVESDIRDFLEACRGKQILGLS